jgi:RNA polymerase sigma factor (sigma-70 family)
MQITHNVTNKTHKKDYTTTGIILNQRKRKLVEQNLNLVHFCIQRFIHAHNGIRPIEYQELYSEGLLALCIAAANFKSTKASFSTYATKVIRNHLINYISFKTEKLPEYYEHDDETEKSPCDDIKDKEPLQDENLYKKEIAIYIREAIDKLSPKEQAVIQHIYFEGYSIRKTAVKLNLSPEYISHLHEKAVKKLKELLIPFFDNKQNICTKEVYYD